MNEGGEEVGAGFSRELYEGVALCFTLFFFFFPGWHERKQDSDTFFPVGQRLMRPELA